MSSYFYLQADKTLDNESFIQQLQEYADVKKQLIYVLNRPLTDQRYYYKYTKALIVLSPNNKIAIINYGKEGEDFEAYVEDIIEDIGSIADKYLYKNIIGRPRMWKSSLFATNIKAQISMDIEEFFQNLTLKSEDEKKKIELLISLFIGSINDVERVKQAVPATILDKVKQKIQLFDGDQTRFVYQQPQKKRIRIQGLSGTGKTELLLHKLKDLYIKDTSSTIFFTCHNKILADSLRRRIPFFFNFMKVEQQIEWEQRLWCTNAWGSTAFPNSGAYRYICDFYQIPFFSYSRNTDFGEFCKLAIAAIKEKQANDTIQYAFTYMLIDESQDFDESFLELCELVTERNVYIAGDIFQSIFDENISNSIEPDFLLGKCYRTDPKTLMFAHALGMGLFEKTKLRWLEEKEWKDCGYNVAIKEEKYFLSREPLRRFEDLDDSFESIRIIKTVGESTDAVIQLIREIIQEHSTIQPDDIGIIFLDTDKDIYRLADILERKIQQNFKWAVNKAYESKEKSPNAVLISNKNNVKGLEFPFVICMTKEIRNNLNYRNSIYTMLTRSFIKSFLLIPSDSRFGLTNEMQDGLDGIIREGQMIIQEPSNEEKERIKTEFQYKIKRLSNFDRINRVFQALGTKRERQETLLEFLGKLDVPDNDEELTELIKKLSTYIPDK